MSRKKTRNTKGVAKAENKRDRSAVILEMFRSFPSRKFTLKSLATASGRADREGRYQTTEIIRSMLAMGTIKNEGHGKYQLNTNQLPSLEGVVSMTAAGNAYVKVEGFDKDIFVDKRHTNFALEGDTVEVVVTRRRAKGDPEGEVIRVVERSKQNYVGVAERTTNHAFVSVDSRHMPNDIFIDRPPKNLKNGDKVVVRIVGWKPNEKSPSGEIVDILGVAGDNTTEMHAILAEFNLPYHFPEEVNKAAEQISTTISEKEYAERRDFRNTTTFTIDPADAKDFDDALSIKALEDGKWEIGVHIADVTHYVKTRGIIEDEARERATSVYLVDRTIPMLPENLSNGLCSLRPNEEKLCFSAVFELDEECNILKEWFGRTVIFSDRRFTYEEAQNVIETGEGDFKEEILTLNRLAKKMRAARFKNGAVAFTREEVKFRLDENGKPLGVYHKVMKESNQLIEEFMLLANKKVAQFVGQNRDGKAGRTMVYRIHDKPNEEKLAKFTNFILKFGYYFKAQKDRDISQEMNRLMDEIKGKGEENVISTLAIRTMSKAVYSTHNIGHYGLAFTHYSHFTSPIRRYPDMMVHRLLAHYLDGGKSVDQNTYEDLCEHSSEMEIRASEAERASNKYKMVEFMLDKIGQEFEGVVSGITDWGIYVELTETHIEGMVSLREMTDDVYMFDSENFRVVGHRTHTTYTLGDPVKIVVKSANLRLRQLDFLMA